MLYQCQMDTDRKFEMNEMTKKPKRELYGEMNPCKYKKVKFDTNYVAYLRSTEIYEHKDWGVDEKVYNSAVNNEKNRELRQKIIYELESIDGYTKVTYVYCKLSEEEYFRRKRETNERKFYDDKLPKEEV